MAARFALAALLIALAPGCADDAAPTSERQAPAELQVTKAQKADIPTWFANAGELRPSVPVDGAFAGTDSAHLYRYAGLAGQDLTITFEADYAPGRGAAIALYSGATGELLHYAADWTRNRVTLEGFELAADGVYWVGVFSGTWRADGAYLVALTQPCGSRGLGPCSVGTFCDHPLGALCGRADAPGTCRPTPDLCPQHEQPVCGCDGRPFGNACKAAQHGISVDYEGPCAGAPPVEPTEPERCETSADCPAATACHGRPAGGEGCCIDTAARPGEGASCAADADCEPALVCIAGSCSPDWMAATFTSTPGAAIPDNDPAGLSDTLVVSCLASVPVTVTADLIIHHSWVGDLVVTLTDASGQVTTTVVDRAGGSDDDLVLSGIVVQHTGDDVVNGPWTLNVSDHAAFDEGTLVQWRLHVSSRWD